MQSQNQPTFTDIAKLTKDEEVKIKKFIILFTMFVQGNKKLNDYSLLETVGKGAFSKIKKCSISRDGKDVIYAVKVRKFIKFSLWYWPRLLIKKFW